MHPTSKLILGSVQFGLDYGINNEQGRPARQEVFDLLNYAYGHGLNKIDTAPVYGEAEQIIGEYLELFPDNKVEVGTKVDLKNYSDWEDSLTHSLKRLRWPNIYSLLFHSLTDYENSYDSIKSKKKPRTADLCGVSLYTNEEILKVANDPQVEVVQVPFNLLDNEYQRGELFRELKKNGKVIHVRSIFLQGLFFMNMDMLSSDFDSLRPLLQGIKNICDEINIPVGALALQYALSKEYIDGVVFGVDNINQLRTNLDWLKIDVSEQVFRSIDELKVEQTSLINPSTW